MTKIYVNFLEFKKKHYEPCQQEYPNAKHNAVLRTHLFKMNFGYKHLNLKIHIKCAGGQVVEHSPAPRVVRVRIPTGTHRNTTVKRCG